MLSELPLNTVTDPVVLALILALVAGVTVGRDVLMESVSAEAVALAAAGIWVGWKYDLTEIIEVIPGM